MFRLRHVYLSLQISDVHKEGCTLKWAPPADDGGAPIDHYLVEKLDTETGRWMPALKTKDPKVLENRKFKVIL